jgi:hypothetical protein
MNLINLSLKSEGGTVDEVISGTFDTNDVDLLRRFIRLVDRVRESTLLRNGLPNITNISWNAEDGMKFTCRPYANSELHELLHVLRPLILQKESTSFHNIAGLLGKKFNSMHFRGHIKLLRTIFEDGELKPYMQISLGDQPLFDDSTLKLWLNAEQYHVDDEKAEKWQDFERSLNTENTRAFVITQLHAKVKAIFGIEYIVKLILEKSQD